MPYEKCCQIEYTINASTPYSTDTTKAAIAAAAATTKNRLVLIAPNPPALNSGQRIKKGGMKRKVSRHTVRDAGLGLTSISAAMQIRGASNDHNRNLMASGQFRLASTDEKTAALGAS